MFPTTVGKLRWLVNASVSASAVKARVGGGVMVWVSTYSAHGWVLASAVVVSKLVGRVCIGRLGGQESIPPSCVVFQRSLFHIVGGA